MNSHVMNRTVRALPALAAAAMAIAMAAGCQKKAEQATKEPFFADSDQPRQINRFSEVQAASGARADATLRAAHFDGVALNSLGEDKLDLMLRDDDACTPISIFVDVPEDDFTKGRTDAVKVFLRDRGLADNQVKVAVGPNKGKTFYAAPSIRAMKLIESGAPVGTNPEPMGSAAGGSSMTN